jgi:phosphoribosyl 1,2-cyclic phosphodiesterase
VSPSHDGRDLPVGAGSYSRRVTIRTRTFVGAPDDAPRPRRLPSPVVDETDDDVLIAKLAARAWDPGLRFDTTRVSTAWIIRRYGPDRPKSAFVWLVHTKPRPHSAPRRRLHRCQRNNPYCFSNSRRSTASPGSFSAAAGIRQQLSDARPDDRAARPARRDDTLPTTTREIRTPLMPTPDAVLSVLGCATPYPRPGEPCSGYLLQADGATVWIDAGPGTFAELQRHVPVDQVDAIWVSHLHPDHCTDVLAAWNLYINTPDQQRPRPTVIVPAKWTQNFDRFLARPGALDEVFDTIELREDTTFTVRGLTLTARRMLHGVPTYGLRATTASGTTVAYSADTGPCTALTELAADADLLVAEAGAATDSTGHCTPENAARAAADGLSPDEATRRAAGAARIKPEIAHPGWTTSLAPRR